MSENQCLRCGRPTPDGVVCTAETARAAGQLAEIADMTPAARDIATGQARHGGGAGNTGKPGSRLPLDLGATQRLDAVENCLAGWARHIAEERGLADLDFYRPTGDQLVWLARWLVSGLEWWRHRPEVDEVLTDVEACARVVRGLARGPAAQRFLGPCGASVLEDVTEIVEGGGPGIRTYAERICDGDVYAREGASEGACRVCGARWSTAERAAWLDDEVRAHAFRAAHIADAYSINIKTIRSWADRGLLVRHGWDGYDKFGNRRPTYNVGDVLDLAAGDAARREEARAKRARRMEQRSGEEAA